LHHDDPLHPTDIPGSSRHRQTHLIGELENSLCLAITNLQHRTPAASEKAGKVVEEPTNQIEAIGTAIEGLPRIMPNFRRYPANIIRRHIREICSDQVPRRSGT
jgi:hypothetical protein